MAMTATQLQEQMQANLWFERLVPLLADRKLPCENGPARVCSPDEFMFMHADQIGGYFKHSASRNYIVVKRAGVQGTFDVPSPNGYELFVPFRQSAFEKGFFDAL
ncbi:MAG: hypothetical protein B7Z37_20980 [Verrucomicrobia bacterium 12-59-8]|nr:MAG: hypothetical protein B7Z37_20980 [Verrucomicrobia bacterium 12-59-8]